MNHLYIGHLSFSTLQHSGQAHSKGKVPILGKILCTEQWRRKEQDNKTKNRTANRFHFIPPTNSYEIRATFCTVATFLVAATIHRLGKILCRKRATQPDMRTAVPEFRPNLLAFVWRDS